MNAINRLGDVATNSIFWRLNIDLKISAIGLGKCKNQQLQNNLDGECLLPLLTQNEHFKM